MASSRPEAEASIIDTLGEEVVRIVAPVSVCMLLVVILVSSLSSSAALPPPSPSVTPSGSSSPSPSDNIFSALITAAVFVVAVTAATFLLALLFYLRCNACLKYYTAFSALTVLFVLGGIVLTAVVWNLRIPVDVATFLILLTNLAAVAAASVLFQRAVPILLNQGALVVIAVLTAYYFTWLPEWTTFVLLVAMAVYDLAAVLLPIGPLRVLIEIAMSRNEDIPALVYEARPVRHGNGIGPRGWRGRSSPVGREGEVNMNPGERGNAVEGSRRQALGDLISSRGYTEAMEDRRQELLQESVDLSASAAASEVVIEATVTGEVPSELRIPLIQQQPLRSDEGEGQDAELEGIGLGSSGAIKLGLGDFIFYSVLVGRAAMYDYMTVYACYLAVIAGLGVTLLLLAVLRKALPALPVSITLGLLFYLLARLLMEVFVVQCSVNLLMF